MNFSTEQSEITDLTKEIERFSALVELYSDCRSTEEMLMSEINRFESIMWENENLFNQLFAYSVLAAAYGALKSKKLNYTKVYYTNEYVYKEISYYHNVQYIVSRVKKRTMDSTIFYSI